MLKRLRSMSIGRFGVGEREKRECVGEWVSEKSINFKKVSKWKKDTEMKNELAIE